MGIGHVVKSHEQLEIIDTKRCCINFSAELQLWAPNYVALNATLPTKELPIDDCLGSDLLILVLLYKPYFVISNYACA
jgi:hypothetical protein